MADVNINALAGQAPIMTPPFWDTVQYDKSAGCYRCQLDEQWFVLTKETLREAFQITPASNNQAFISPSLTDALINFVNELGYPKLILWGIVTRAHIDYAERIWEEFTQSIHTFIEDKRNLAQDTSMKKKATLIVIPKPILGYLKFSAKGTKREVFGMHIPGSLITADIQEASYYQEYLANVAKHRRYLAGETGSDQDSHAPKPTQPARKPKSTTPKAPPRPSVSIPVTSAQLEPTFAPAKTQGKKRKPTTKTSDKPSKAKKIQIWLCIQKTHSEKALEEGLKSMYDVPRGLLPPVVIREPESGKYQPLPEVPGKGKAKVTEEQVVHDLLSLRKLKKKSHADQYIFQRRTFTPTGSSGHDESSYAELGQSDSEEESEKVVPGADARGQGEGQARPEPHTQPEGQAGPDPGAQDEGHAGSNPDKQSEG
uniref:Histone deacetylase 14 n=1 Tax=Tanacetum cinerariifolium TaxID=118510 RepID=A0A6L2KFA1_TANCI|nr:histone deacetylase 14 [Tanacetum cinerariifolium]